MGLYDTVRSSYPLGEGFTNVELQTKSLQDDLGGFFDFYWIDPSGRLFEVDYSGTQEPVWQEDGVNWPVTYTPTGKKGQVTPVYWTGRLDLINEKGKRQLLLFHGQVIDRIYSFPL